MVHLLITDCVRNWLGHVGDKGGGFLPPPFFLSLFSPHLLPLSSFLPPELMTTTSKQHPSRCHLIHLRAYMSTQKSWCCSGTQSRYSHSIQPKLNFAFQSQIKQRSILLYNSPWTILNISTRYCKPCLEEQPGKIKAKKFLHTMLQWKNFVHSMCSNERYSTKSFCWRNFLCKDQAGRKLKDVSIMSLHEVKMHHESEYSARYSI